MDTLHDKIAAASPAARALWLAAALAVVAGLALGVRAERGIRETRARLKRSEGYLARLGVFESDLRRWQDARRAFAEVGTNAPADPAAFVENCLPGARAEDARETFSEFAGGWGAWRKEFSFKNVPLPGVMALVREAESCRPPWRLDTCTIRASSAMGRGDVVLAFQTLIPSLPAAPGRAAE